jgi:ferredoxin--NADP+ reductase
VVGPLGNQMEIDYYGTVMCVGGCYGIASIYPIARALKAKGNRVEIVIEARSSFLFFWQDKLKKVSDRLTFITRDGTLGQRGHITLLPEIIGRIDHDGISGRPVDRLIINGCNFVMMRGAEASRPLNIKTIVSLNTLMIDGTGMCGVCRVTVDGKTKFACVDGPHFDGHLVDWGELAQRRKAYIVEELIQFQSSAAS